MNLILSADENWGIGKDNQLLFRAPADMRYFRAATMGGAVVMGRKTWQSLPGGKPLPGRVNVVLSRSAAAEPSGQPDSAASAAGGPTGPLNCDSLPALAACLRALALPPSKIWVIGGESVYRQLLPYCREAWVTRFLAAGPADRHMADLGREAGWRQTVTGEVQMWEDLQFRFDRYQQETWSPLPE
jgi:dihydrofolate reductase